MVIVLRSDRDPKKTEMLKQRLRDRGFELHESKGTSSKLIGLVGDTSVLDVEDLLAIDDLCQSLDL